MYEAESLRGRTGADNNDVVLDFFRRIVTGQTYPRERYRIRAMSDRWLSGQYPECRKRR